MLCANRGKNGIDKAATKKIITRHAKIYYETQRLLFLLLSSQFYSTLNVATRLPLPLLLHRLLFLFFTPEPLESADVSMHITKYRGIYRPNDRLW